MNKGLNHEEVTTGKTEVRTSVRASITKTKVLPPIIAGVTTKPPITEPPINRGVVIENTSGAVSGLAAVSSSTGAGTEYSQFMTGGAIGTSAVGAGASSTEIGVNIAGAGAALGTGQAIVRDTGVNMSGPIVGNTTQMSTVGTGQAIVRDTGINMSGPIVGNTTQMSAVGTTTQNPAIMGNVNYKPPIVSNIVHPPIYNSVPNAIVNTLNPTTRPSI